MQASPGSVLSSLDPESDVTATAVPTFLRYPVRRGTGGSGRLLIEVSSLHLPGKRIANAVLSCALGVAKGA